MFLSKTITKSRNILFSYLKGCNCTQQSLTINCKLNMPYTSETFITKIVKSASYEHKTNKQKKTLSKRLLSHFLTRTNSYIKSGCLSLLVTMKIMYSPLKLDLLFSRCCHSPSQMVQMTKCRHKSDSDLVGLSKVNPEDFRWDIIRQVWWKNLYNVKRLLPDMLTSWLIFLFSVSFSRPIHFNSFAISTLTDLTPRGQKNYFHLVL